MVSAREEGENKEVFETEKLFSPHSAVNTFWNQLRL